jgi:hypothetical protein
MGSVHPDGVCQLVCYGCRQRFGVVYGKLTGWSSKQEAMLYLNARLPSFYKRRYQLRITTPGRDLRVLTFSVPGARDCVPVHPGDRISVLYSLRGDSLKKLVSIYNHTLGKAYHLATPVPSLAYLLETRGALLVVFFLISIFSGLGGVGIYSLWAIAVLLYTRLIDTARLTRPPLSSDVSAEARLLEERNWMHQKDQLQNRIEALRAESRSHRDLLRRIQTLREKMLTFNASLYTTRINNLESAARLLKQRIQHNQHLVDQYFQTIHMIDIELEAAYLSDQLPEVTDTTGTLLSRLNELKAIEKRNRDLWLQLEANEEVRRLGYT